LIKSLNVSLIVPLWYLFIGLLSATYDKP